MRSGYYLDDDFYISQILHSIPEDGILIAVGLSPPFCIYCSSFAPKESEFNVMNVLARIKKQTASATAGLIVPSLQNIAHGT